MLTPLSWGVMQAGSWCSATGVRIVMMSHSAGDFAATRLLSAFLSVNAHFCMSVRSPIVQGLLWCGKIQRLSQYPRMVLRLVFSNALEQLSLVLARATEGPSSAQLVHNIVNITTFHTKASNPKQQENH